MCDLVWQTDRQQYMRRIQRTRCAGRTTGSTNAILIQKNQKRLSLNETETEVYIVWQSFYAVTIETAVRNLLFQSAFAIPTIPGTL